jgi:divalent metal cation (Fe/Co/Zn/Cd) transporter
MGVVFDKALQPTTISMDRVALVRRGLRLNYATIAYNFVEAVASLAAGVGAGSIALIGFGVDSVIEVTASGAAQWRLRADLDHARRERVERTTLRVIGWSFVALAIYVFAESVMSLLARERPERSVLGTTILTLSVIVMPILARAKRRVARELRSGSLEAEAMQTSLCAYLSAIALAGVALNTVVGWWWCDPVAALAMTPIIAKEGIERIREEPHCDTR